MKLTSSVKILKYTVLSSVFFAQKKMVFAKTRREPKLFFRPCETNENNPINLLTAIANIEKPIK